MSELKPENEALVAELMEKTRVGFVTAKNLLWKDTTGIGRAEIERTPQAEALDATLGAFAFQNLDDKERIHDLPLPDSVKEAAAAYMGLIIAKKLDWAVFDQYRTQHEAEVTNLLQGRTINARSLHYSIGVGDGHTLRKSPDGPFEVTAPFLGYKASTSSLWLGIPEQSYQVQLWEENYHDTEIEQAAIIAIQ
jgi:hypothetical protein